MSLLQYLNCPEQFRDILLTFSFILFLSPYFNGCDFGIIRIPEFSNKLKKRLQFIGPILIILSIAINFPFFQETSKDLEPGIYLKKNGFKGDKIGSNMILFIKPDELNEIYNDRPFKLKHVLNSCLFKDISNDKYISWNDLSTCK